MRSLNPLETKFRRLLTFFLLYVAEGLPHGFATVAVVTEMRSRGVRPAMVTGFAAIILLPWAWKWAMGPIVDVIYSNRLGRRRAWIVGAQVMMVLTLMVAMPVDFTANIKLFTGVLIVLNIFSAVQDVAIDALACSVLRENERGLANGLMFGGAHTGEIIGGAGVLLLADYLSIYLTYVSIALSALAGEIVAGARVLLLANYGSFNLTYIFVILSIVAIILLVSMRLKEPAPEEEPLASEGTRLSRVWEDIRIYVLTALRAMFGNRAAFAAMVFALLPAGAFALSSPILTNLGVEFGMDRGEIAHLKFVTGIIWIAGCVIGGLLSDRFGRKRMLALYCLGTVIPTLYLAAMLSRHGWIMPADTSLANRPSAAPALLVIFWIAASAYNVFNGLMYGTRTALFMDITTPAIAATQFTAYMALLNITISYSTFWLGLAVENWGYPTMLSADCALGLVCILLLPLIKRRT